MHFLFERVHRFRVQCVLVVQLLLQRLVSFAHVGHGHVQTVETCRVRRVLVVRVGLVAFVQVGQRLIRRGLVRGQVVAELVQRRTRVLLVLVHHRLALLLPFRVQLLDVLLHAFEARFQHIVHVATLCVHVLHVADQALHSVGVALVEFARLFLGVGLARGELAVEVVGKGGFQFGQLLGRGGRVVRVLLLLLFEFQLQRGDVLGGGRVRFTLLLGQICTQTVELVRDQLRVLLALLVELVRPPLVGRDQIRLRLFDGAPEVDKRVVVLARCVLVLLLQRVDRLQQLLVRVFGRLLHGVFQLGAPVRALVAQLRVERLVVLFQRRGHQGFHVLDPLLGRALLLLGLLLVHVHQLAHLVDALDHFLLGGKLLLVEVVLQLLDGLLPRLLLQLLHDFEHLDGGRVEVTQLRVHGVLLLLEHVLAHGLTFGELVNGLAQRLLRTVELFHLLVLQLAQHVQLVLVDRAVGDGVDLLHHALHQRALLCQLRVELLVLRVAHRLPVFELVLFPLLVGCTVLL